jgi:hypothetical protein
MLGPISKEWLGTAIQQLLRESKLPRALWGCVATTNRRADARHCAGRTGGGKYEKMVDNDGEVLLASTARA